MMKMVRVDWPGYSIISGPVLCHHIPPHHTTSGCKSGFPAQYLFSTVNSPSHPIYTLKLIGHSLPCHGLESGTKDTFTCHPITGIFPCELFLTLSPHHVLQPHPISRLGPWHLKETSVGPGVGKPAFCQVHPHPPGFHYTPPQDQVKQMVFLWPM